jgi:hypothetical protein
MNYIFSLFLVLVFITNCQSRSEILDFSTNLDLVEFDSFASGSFVDNSSEKSPKIAENADIIKKKNIREGNVEIRVLNIDNAKLKIDSLVKLYEGYYANESLNNSNWNSFLRLKIRVPNEDFDAFVSDVMSESLEIVSKNISTRDVTDQFIDLESRLETKRSYLSRYKEILKSAKSVREILDVEDKIRVLEEEIEATTGKLKYLNNLVLFCSLDLTVSKKTDFTFVPKNRGKFTERMKKAFSEGWHRIVDSLLFGISLWPVWILAASVFFFWKKFIRRNFNNHS